MFENKNRLDKKEMRILSIKAWTSQIYMPILFNSHDISCHETPNWNEDVIFLVSCLLCSQCSSEEDDQCRSSPPRASPCPSHQHKYCLTLKEYLPSLTDDADANQDDNDDAGSMIFLARSCVEQSQTDTCTVGVRDEIAVTVCRWVQ